MSKYLLVIRGDMNDGDYIESSHIIQMKDLPTIKKVAKAIKDYDNRTTYAHNWNRNDYSQDESPFIIYSDVLTEEDIETFNSYVPRGGDFGIHSIESIKIYPFTKEEILL